MQAHIDRAMAALGKDYATPSRYAARGSQQFVQDVLSKQDEIAATLFSVDKEGKRDVSNRVREAFIRFFLVTFAGYKFYVNSESNRMDNRRFLKSLNLPNRQNEFVKMIVVSQMFDIFLQDSRSIRHQRLFDEYVIKHRLGNFSIHENKESILSGGGNRSKKDTRTPLLDSLQWRKSTIIVPEQPCHVGLRDGLVYCNDRRFPDHLDPGECITNKSVSFWKLLMDGTCCSPFSSCT